MTKPARNDLLAVAWVKRPFGIHGELLLEIVAGSAGFIRQVQIFYVGPQNQARKVVSFRSRGSDLVLRLADCSNRSQAEELRDAVLYVRADQLPPLPQGTYYPRQLVGLQVATEEGQPLGRLKAVLATGANDVYVIRGSQGEILLPAISSVVREIRLSEGRIVVRLPEGLIVP
jgi:16S rRNA processing protein RimM